MRKTTSAILALLLLNCSAFLESDKGPFSKFLPPISVFANSETPIVTGIWPTMDATAVDPGTEIFVSFSRPMNHEFTESAFSLNRNGSRLDGSFRWGYNTLIFKPAPRLDQPGQYQVAVSAGLAESDTGVNLLDDFTSRFTFNRDVVEPVVSSTIPPNGAQGVANTASFTVDFSEPMDITSVLSQVSSTPSMDFNLPATIISNGNRTFQFVPLSNLSYSTVYTVSVPNTIKDQAGNNLAQSYSFNFTVGSDFTAPQLIEISTASVANFVANEFNIQGGLEKDEGIILGFDEPVQPSTVLSGVVFSPGVTFTLTDISGTNSRFLLTPTENLDINQVYQITVSGAIKDTQDNSLNRTYNYYAQINGPHSQFIQIREIYKDAAFTLPLNTAGIDTTLACQNLIPIPAPPAGSCDYNALNVYFCWGPTRAGCAFPMAGGSSILLNTLQYTLSKDFGVSEVAVPYFAAPADVTSGAFAPDQFVFRSQLHDLTQTVTYSLTIKGGKTGVRDSRGNYMQDDFMVRLRIP